MLEEVAIEGREAIIEVAIKIEILIRIIEVVINTKIEATTNSEDSIEADIEETEVVVISIELIKTTMTVTISIIS